MVLRKKILESSMIAIAILYFICIKEKNVKKNTFSIIGLADIPY